MRKLRSLIIFFVTLIITCMTVYPETRLYSAVGDHFAIGFPTPNGYIPDIEYDASADSLFIGEINSSRGYLMARCSIKNISDSFYIINSNPLESAFDDMRIKVFDDTTLNGKVRVTVLTKYSFSNNYRSYPDCLYSKEPVDGIYLWEYTPEEKERDWFKFTIYFKPTVFELEQNRLLDTYMGMDKNDYHLTICDNPAFFTPDKNIVIELPNFSSNVFCQYYIRDNIILLTDDKLVWNGITYRRSRFNSLTEKQQNIDSLKPWPSKYDEFDVVH